MTYKYADEIKANKNLNWLFELRGVGDYGGLVHVAERDARQSVRAASEFLEAITVLLEKRKGA